MNAIRIASHFNGPPGIGNGGYSAGMFAAPLGYAGEVTLRSPVPLDEDLAIVREGEPLAIQRTNGEIVAIARPAEVEIEPPVVTTIEGAREAVHGLVYPGHPFPGCFVCGTERAEGQGMRVFPALLPGRDDVVVAPWEPYAALAGSDGNVRPEFAWAALDCAGAFAASWGMPRPIVLGRITARIESPIAADEPQVILGWRIGQEGRKHHVGTAIFSADGRVRRGIALATWFVVDDAYVAAAAAGRSA